MQYRQNYIPKSRLWLVIWLAVSAGMGVMYLGIMADSTAVAMIAFFATVVVIVTSFIEAQLITADTTGITEKSARRYRWSILARTFEKKHMWNSVESYLWDKDLSRSGVERWFLKLNFSNGDNLTISQPQDKSEQANFDAITAGILKVIETKNPQTLKDVNPSIVSKPVIENENVNTPGRENEPDIEQHDDFQASTEERLKSLLEKMNRNSENETAWNPVEQKGFYRKMIGKSLSLFFASFTIIIAIAIGSGYGSWSSVFRLLVVLVPGSAYMIYRSFFSSK